VVDSRLFRVTQTCISTETTKIDECTLTVRLCQGSLMLDQESLFMIIKNSILSMSRKFKIMIINLIIRKIILIFKFRKTPPFPQFERFMVIFNDEESVIGISDSPRN
jgi:hypothetical protein